MRPVTDGLHRDAALLVLFVIPTAAAVWLGAVIVRRGHGQARSELDLAFVAFSLYVILVGVLTLAPPPLSLSNGHFGTNLVPVIYSVRCFVPNPGQPPTTLFCLQSMAANVALFLPLGFLLPTLSERFRSAKEVLKAALALSVAIEMLQYAGRWLGNPRWTDVDDVLLNTLGALMGYCLFRLVAKPKRGVSYWH